MHKMLKRLLMFSFCALLYTGDSSKILAVFPGPTYSHVIIGDVLGRELAKRGHEVTVISPQFQQQIEVPSTYKFIELNVLREYMQELSKDDNLYGNRDTNNLFKSYILFNLGYEKVKFFFENVDVQRLLKTKESYDLIIMDHFFSEALFGLCHFYEAPCIAISATGIFNWANRLSGNVGLASYIPHMLTTFSPKMSFFERVNNLVLLMFEEILFHVYFAPKLNKLMHQHIPDAPHLYDLMHNVSMVFVNSHPALSSPIAIPPNMKELGGIHVEGLKNAKLPTDVQKFLDDHNEGVVYFALGSKAKGKDMPKEKLQEIVKALKRWGNPVLWKYEEKFPDTLDNVKIGKWFPQTAVLAHKNVIAFISHCGRLSSLESIYYGVPMIGLPVFGDQPHNAIEMDYHGYAIALTFQTVNAENLYNALVEITTNKKYTEEAKVRSKAMQKQNSLKEAIYWVEHVIEFEGASYLKNTGVDLPWYQLWMIDVIGLLTVSFLLCNVVVAYLMLRLLTSTPIDVEKKKR